MWNADLPDDQSDLRQGDLLHGIFLPRVGLPLRYVLAAGASATSGTPVMVDCGSSETYIVTTQCCSIENQKTVSLAPVRRQRMSEGQTRDLYARTDPTATTESIVANFHLLDPVGPLQPEASGLLNVADLTQIISIGGERAELRAHRVASMSPAGRRALRMRLAHFFGRVEAEDLEWFVENGLPPGPEHPV